MQLQVQDDTIDGFRDDLDINNEYLSEFRSQIEDMQQNQSSKIFEESITTSDCEKELTNNIQALSLELTKLDESKAKLENQISKLITDYKNTTKMLEEEQEKFKALENKLAETKENHPSELNLKEEEITNITNNNNEIQA